MSNKIIRSALEGHLKTWAAAQVPPLPVFLENRSKVPATGERHLRGDLIPAATLDPSPVSYTHLTLPTIYSV